VWKRGGGTRAQSRAMKSRGASKIPLVPSGTPPKCRSSCRYWPDRPRNAPVPPLAWPGVRGDRPPARRYGGRSALP
jgi:hypothetical protein